MKRLLFLLTFCLPVHASFFIPDHAVTFPKRPAGEVITWGGASCPAGTQALNGASLLRAGTYAGLFAILGTTYGAVDGTHFTVPNTQGVFIRGAGTQAPYTGTRGVFQSDVFASHTHGAYSGNGSGVVTTLGQPIAQGFAGIFSVAGPGYYFNQGNPPNLPFIQPSGSGTETRPANIVLLYCIIY